MPSVPSLPPSDNPAPLLPHALQAPWRLAYLEAMEGAKGGGSGSFLADAWQTPEADEANLVVRRSSAGLIMLNKYPYANGHVLVALGEARPALLEYTREQRAALWALVDEGVELVQRALSPQGVNIGVNQGRAAGAGVPQHLHVHIVPRWAGDVNFMNTISGVRVMPGSLRAMWERYRAV